MAAKQHCSTKPASSGGAGDLDPKFEWIENAMNYVLRINLSGFKKDDFRVQVDGAGRLTVRGHRPASGPSFHKVFQLPSTASLDEITGRFDASVLTLTVPKKAAAAPPTTIEEIRKPKAKEEEAAPKPPPRDPADGAKQLSSTKDDRAQKKGAAGVKPKEETDKEDAFKKALDEATRRAAQQKEEEEDRRKQQEREQKPSPAAREEVVKPKATEAAAAPPEKPAPAVAKPSAPLKPDVASGEKPRQAVDRESLAERVRQRSEEERAKAAAAAAAEQKKKTSACATWKERVASELEELTEMKWAQGLVETARNNKEVVATAIAAFSLGFFVSQKLFSRK